MLVGSRRSYHSPSSTATVPAARIMLADKINTCASDLDVMKAGEIPDDSNWPEMVSLAQMQNFLDDSRRCSIDRVLGDRLLVDQACFAFLF